MNQTEIVEEVDWLLSFQVPPDAIAHQLGKSLTALEQTLRRAGRNDLLPQIREEISRRRYYADTGQWFPPPQLGREAA